MDTNEQSASNGAGQPQLPSEGAVANGEENRQNWRHALQCLALVGGTYASVRTDALARLRALMALAIEAVWPGLTPENQLLRMAAHRLVSRMQSVEWSSPFPAVSGAGGRGTGGRGGGRGRGKGKGHKRGRPMTPAIELGTLVAQGSKVAQGAGIKPKQVVKTAQCFFAIPKKGGCWFAIDIEELCERGLGPSGAGGRVGGGTTGGDGRPFGTAANAAAGAAPSPGRPSAAAPLPGFHLTLMQQQQQQQAPPDGTGYPPHLTAGTNTSQACADGVTGQAVAAGVAAAAEAAAVQWETDRPDLAQKMRDLNQTWQEQWQQQQQQQAPHQEAPPPPPPEPQQWQQQQWQAPPQQPIPVAVPQGVVLVARASDCARLHAAVGGLLPGRRLVGVDCEGVSLSKTGELCLVQVYFPPPVDTCFAYDLVAAKANGPAAVTAVRQSLCELLEDETITKVLHDCRQDTAALLYQTGARVENLVDTQVLYGMLQRTQADGPGRRQASLLREGLNTLLTRYGLDQNPHKDDVHAQMRSDPDIWLRRPLSAALLRYAAADVAPLVALAEQLLRELGEAGVAREAAAARSAAHGEWHYDGPDRRLLPAQGTFAARAGLPVNADLLLTFKPGSYLPSYREITPDELREMAAPAPTLAPATNTSCVTTGANADATNGAMAGADPSLQQQQQPRPNNGGTGSSGGGGVYGGGGGGVVAEAHSDDIWSLLRAMPPRVADAICRQLQLLGGDGAQHQLCGGGGKPQHDAGRPQQHDCGGGRLHLGDGGRQQHGGGGLQSRDGGPQQHGGGLQLGDGGPQQHGGGGLQLLDGGPQQHGGGLQLGDGGAQQHGGGGLQSSDGAPQQQAGGGGLQLGDGNTQQNYHQQGGGEEEADAFIPLSVGDGDGRDGEANGADSPLQLPPHPAKRQRMADGSAAGGGSTSGGSVGGRDGGGSQEGVAVEGNGGGGGEGGRAVAEPLRPRRQLVEIVIDLNRDVALRFSSGYEEDLTGVRVSMQEALQALGAKESDLPHDDRLGIPGTLHRISAVRAKDNRVVGLTYRVGRHISGVATLIQDVLAAIITQGQCSLSAAADGRSGDAGNASGRGGDAGDAGGPSFLDELHDKPLSPSLLILGPPGAGKTTLLRDVVRLFAGPPFGLRVAVVDTSNEIAGEGLEPHPCIGRARRFSVPRGKEQAEVLLRTVANHNPQVLVVDEISSAKEVTAVKINAEKGVIMVGTAHGSGLSSLLRNPELAPLVGGLQPVILGDSAASKSGDGRKTRLERKGAPVFGTLLEMEVGGRWRLHTNVAASVDALLSGGLPDTQLRRTEAGGRAMVVRFEPGCSADRRGAGKRRRRDDQDGCWLDRLLEPAC